MAPIISKVWSFFCTTLRDDGVGGAAISRRRTIFRRSVKQPMTRFAGRHNTAASVLSLRHLNHYFATGATTFTMFVGVRNVGEFIAAFNHDPHFSCIK